MSRSADDSVVEVENEERIQSGLRPLQASLIGDLDWSHKRLEYGQPRRDQQGARLLGMPIEPPLRWFTKLVFGCDAVDEAHSCRGRGSSTPVAANLVDLSINLGRSHRPRGERGQESQELLWVALARSPGEGGLHNARAGRLFEGGCSRYGDLAAGAVCRHWWLPRRVKSYYASPPRPRGRGHPPGLDVRGSAGRRPTPPSARLNGFAFPCRRRHSPTTVRFLLQAGHQATHVRSLGFALDRFVARTTLRPHPNGPSAQGPPSETGSH